MNRPSATTATQLRHIEGEFSLGDSPEPDRVASLRQLMEIYRVPALGLALIDEFHLQAVRTYGVVEAGSTQRSTPSTLFQAGSISKPVAAAGALRLVEAGRLSLDANVNDTLRGWKVPENEFTRKEPVSLRRLLSHTSGLTVHFFPGYPRDQALPTIDQVLEGAPPANTAPVRVDRVPGSEWRYSGGGYLVAQQLMGAATSQSFPSLLHDQVFDPLGLHDSTYEQPLPEGRWSAAATGTLRSGESVPGGWHVYPEMAAAGLWSTAGDLAEVLARVARAARGEGGGWMSQETARLMITPQTGPTNEFMFGDATRPDRMGLGFQVDGSDPPQLFGHLGDDAGFQALAVMSPETGQGIAIMTNSDLGLIVAQIVRAQVYRVVGWNAPGPTARLDPELLTSWLIASRSGEPQATEAAYRITLESHTAPASQYTETLIGLGYAFASEGRLPEAEATFRLAVTENPGHWNAHDSLGEVLALLGRTDEAIESYRRSVELNPENRNAVARLAQLGSAT